MRTLPPTYQKDSQPARELISIFQTLRDQVDGLDWSQPVELTYNPLQYAWPVFAEYLRRFAGQNQVVMVGMNPGPWGMAQTGVPFGEVAAVRDWMQLSGEIGQPREEHPKRAITGLDCARSEVSGRRLWGWARDRYQTPKQFFDRFFVLNYCPLLFLESSARNLTPDRLAAVDRPPLFAACDRALKDAMAVLKPRLVIGIGRFAGERCRQVLSPSVQVGTVLHPSPASPAANRGWAQQAEQQLAALGAF